MLSDWPPPKISEKEDLPKLTEAHIYQGLPPTLQHLETAAENFFDDLNNHHQDQIRRAVRHMKKRARACLAKLGGTFEGRRI